MSIPPKFLSKILIGWLERFSPGTHGWVKMFFQGGGGEDGRETSPDSPCFFSPGTHGWDSLFFQGGGEGDGGSGHITVITRFSLFYQCHSSVTYFPEVFGVVILRCVS